MGGNSTTWMNTAVLVTCIRNFRKNRGPASGILKGYVGLSTAIFTDLCTALSSKDPSTILILLSIIPFVVCLAAILFLREVPPSATEADEKEESQFFNLINVLAVIVAVYLLLFDFTGPVNRVYSIGFAIGLFILLLSPIMIPAYSFLKSLKFKNLDVEEQVVEPLLNSESIANGTTQNANVGEVVPSAGRDEDVVVEKKRPVIGEEHTIYEALMTLDFWILFVSFLCGVGTGLTVMNNMGQMGSSLGYTNVSIFVSFTSIFGFFGRIISGTVSEYSLK